MRTKLAGRCYRLGLAAAKRRDLSAALRYACFACILDAGHDGAARLAEICRYELGEGPDCGQEFEQAAAFARQRKWAKAARALRNAPRQSVRLLNIQGCLWALAKHRAAAAGCFSKALVKDCGNILASDALAEFGRRRRFFGGFFDPL
jgi:hypothetical protein